MIHNKENGNGSSGSGLMRARETAAEEEINLSEIIGIINSNKWLALVVILFSLAIAIFYIHSTPNKYKTNALIQVEGKTEDVSSAMQNLSNEINWQSSAAKPSQIEASLIHSRYILEPTIRKLGLNISAQRVYFPFIGKYFADKNTHIKVKKFEVPDAFLGENFYLTSKEKNRFELRKKDGDLILEGDVGELVSYSSDNDAIPYVKILVSELNAPVGAKFMVKSRHINDVLNGFDASLVITDIGQSQGGGIQGSKADTGILNLELTGFDKRQIPMILNTVLYYEVAKNIAKKSAEIEKTLGFLDEQLPDLKKSLDAAETRLSNYRGKKGSLGMNIEGSVLFGQLVSEEQKLEQAKLKKAELRQDFTDEHPYLIAINRDIDKLAKNLNQLEAKVKTLPKTEQVAINLERDVTTKSQLYSYLLGKIQQLQILKAGTISDVRILVAATPPTTVPTQKRLIILASLLFGLIFGVALIFIRRLFLHGVSDPNVLEERTGVPVYALIPHSKAQEQLFRDMQRKIPGTGPFVLAMRKPKDIAIESLRSLRTTLKFALQETSGNIITVLGGKPSIGKSFVSLNLAKVIADSEQRVLLIDADLRKGKINSYLSQKTSPGLSEVLQEKISFEEAKRVLKQENFHFLPAGIFPENPSELLFNGKLKQFISEIVPKYDAIVIDTPPVLAVTDPFIIAKYAAINLFVVGAGAEPIGMIEHSIKRLQQNGIIVNGFVFNNTKQAKNAYGYGNYGYCYEYSND